MNHWFVWLIIYAIVCIIASFFIYISDKIPKKKTRGFMVLYYFLLSLGLILLAPVLLLFIPHFIYSEYKNNKNEKQSDKRRKEQIKQAKIILLNSDLPFKPVSKQIIYIESQYNTELNKYITENYEKICNLFQEKGGYFIYLPKVIENINNDTVTYLFPFLSKENIILNKIETQTIYNNFLSYRTENVNLTGGLLKYKGKFYPNEQYEFSYYQFTNIKETDIGEQFKSYLKSILSGYVLSEVKKSDIKPEDRADFNYGHAAGKLIKEIEERVEKLKQIGVNEMVLKSLLSFNPEVKLSRLIITKDYRILLPDYNKEITMHPLPKALFFLFLKHPEGILFKHLSVHRNELLEIYKKLANKGHIANFRKSIDDLVDPTKNAVNEKRARIREAFIKEFDESIAQNYFIRGNYAEPKKIVLDRELVVIEGDI